MRFVLLVGILWGIVGCANDSGNGPSLAVALQEGTIAVQGHVELAQPAPATESPLDSLVQAASSETPTKVQIRTWQAGATSSSATTVLLVQPDGTFSGNVPTGATYTGVLLDDNGDATNTHALIGTAIGGTDEYVFFDNLGSIADDDDWEVYELVLSNDELTITGTLTAEDLGEPLPTEVELFVLTNDHARWSETIAITTNPTTGQASINTTTPLFNVEHLHVYARALDATGAMVAVTWDVTGTTPSETYAAEETEPGGIMFQEEAGGGAGGGGGAAEKFSKKPAGKTYYQKKIGNVTAVTAGNPLVFCMPCDKNTDKANGSVGTGTHVVEKPTEISCGRSGLNAVGSQGVAINCSRVINEPVSKSWHRSGVTYQFAAFQDKGTGPDVATAGGKSVLDYKWYQSVKIEASYIKAGDETNAENPLTPPKPLQWDNKVGGGAATADDSYPSQATGSSTAKDANVLSDTPNVPVPNNDISGDALATQLGIPAGTDWKTIIIKYTFETYLVCCATNTVIATYKWTLTIKINRAPKAGGGHDYSSEVSTENPTQVEGNQRTDAFNQLAGGATQFPC